MKFATATLAFLAATASAAKINQSLLRQATPVNKDGSIRKLANNDQQFQINGLFSVQFDHCISLTTRDENLFDANWLGAVQDGLVIAEKSFVLFNVCPTAYCSYDSADNLYMVDLATWMASTTNVEVEKKERYCEACRQAENYCTYERYQFNYAEDQAADNAADDQAADNGADDQAADNGAERFLKNNNGNVKYVDCDYCISGGCYEEEDQYAITDDQVVQWIQGVSECQETGYLWNDQPLYLGYMCNERGTGAELALFMDQDCTVYNSMVSFSSEAQSYNGYNDNNQYDHYEMAVKSKQFVQYPFTNDIDCENVEWASPEEEANANNQGGGNNYYEAPEANEACRIVENSVAMADCGYGYGEYPEYREQNADEYDAYSWYVAQLEDEDAENLQATCTVVQKFNGEYSKTHLYNNNKDSGSGNFYDYSAGKKSKNGGKIFGWLLFVALVVGAAVFAVKKFKVKDTKREPLVSGSGALA